MNSDRGALVQDSVALPPLDVTALLEGARLIVIGGTGFLGKVWLSLLLARFPSVGRVYLVVRGREGRDSEARFWTDVASARPFDPLRELHPGADYEAFLASKIEVLDADVSRPMCGFKPERIAALNGTIDAVVNVAGVVDFNPPLDEAIHANAFGVQNLVDLARALGDVPVLHTSTCYVAGYRKGRIEEVDPRETPYPRFEDLKTDKWSPSREITESLEQVAEIHRLADDAVHSTQFDEEARANLEGRQEPATGPAWQEERARVRKKWVRQQATDAGMARAKHWAWPNTYTYTKSLGEQVLAASGLAFTIVRPAVIESSYSFPFAGWNEGINTMAPLMYLFMRGHMQVPTGERTTLDVIPVDMVAGGMIASLAALIQRTHQAVYQLGTSDLNAITMARIVDLCGLYKRRYYQRTGKGSPLFNYLQAHWEPNPVTVSQFYTHGAPALADYAQGVSKFLERASKAVPGMGFIKPASRFFGSYSSIARRNGEIWELFIPFMAETEYRFVNAGLRTLNARMSPEDRARVGWDPDGIDWRVYMHEIQLPGLEKWVLPEIDKKAERPTRPLRAHVSLTAMLAEMADRHEHAPALLRTETDGLSRVTYAELYARAGAVAARLAQTGIAPGDRVLISASNHPEWAIAYFGVLRAGAVAIPVDAAMESLPFGNVLRASGARAVIVDAKVAARHAHLLPETVVRWDLPEIARADATLTPPEVAEATGETLASIIYTSGTTGAPKGVMLSHGNFTALLASLAPVFPLSGGDRLLSVLPLHHTFEFTCGLLLPLSRGARVVYLDELTGEKVVGAMRSARVSAMVGVPALWQLLERRILSEVKARGPAAGAVFDIALSFNRMLGRRIGTDVGKVLFGPVHDALGGNLKYMISGGAALPQDTAKVFAGLGLPLAEGYGLTEAAPVLTVARASVGAQTGNVGKPIPGVELKIHNPDASGVGEVFARGKNVMTGYAGDAENTARTVDSDGWLHTGDLGRLDKHGRLTIVGRSKDVIVSASGENVYPDDVESAVGKLAGVSEIAVVGIPDPKGGERVGCIVVPEVAGEDEDGAAVRERAMKHAKAAFARLPHAWQPAVVHLWGAKLPRTAIGKIKRNEVRATLERLVAATAKVHAAQHAGGGTAGGASTNAGSAAVRSAVAALARKAPHEITGATNLKSDLGFDSLMAMELVVALETINPGVNLNDSIPALETVGAIEAALGIDDELPPARPSLPPPSMAREPESVVAEFVEDEEEVNASVQLPEAVKGVAKAALAVLQKSFYRKVMNVRVSGRAFVPYNRNTLVVANHSSHLDMGLVKHALGSYGKDIVALAAKDYFFDTPLRRTLFENFTNLAPLDRDAGLFETLREVGRLLESGKTVLIFPEGTRSPDGGIRKFKGAFGILALQHQVDILPVYLGGTFEALSRDSVIPTRRDLVARIGPPLTHDELARITRGMRPIEAARVVARLTQRAVESLRDGQPLDLKTVQPAELTTKRKHPLVVLFDELNARFKPGAVDAPVSFYFTLGTEAEAKWTVRVDPSACQVVQGKPDGGTADCVLKTSPEMFTKIVREGYTPGPGEFMSGLIKSNDVGLLLTFQKVFDLVN